MWGSDPASAGGACAANLRGESDDDGFYADLTDRELDVLKRIANGLNNSQIAESLVISGNTVKGQCHSFGSATKPPRGASPARRFGLSFKVDFKCYARLFLLPEKYRRKGGISFMFAI